MLIGILFLLSSITIALINFYLSKNVFFPPTLFSIVWVVVLTSYCLFLFSHNKPNFEFDIKTLIVFLVGQILFTIGGLTALLSRKKNVGYNHSKTSPIIKFNLDKWLLVVLLLILPFYIVAIIKIVEHSKYANINFYVALRHEFVNNGASLGIFEYANTLAVFSFCIFQYKLNFALENHKSKFRNSLYKTVYYITVFIFAFLTTGRTYFFLLITIYLTYKVLAKKIEKKHIVWGFAIFILIFIGNAFILSKGVSADESVSDNFTSILDSFTIYFLGGAYGFDSSVKSAFQFELGENVFRFFITVAHSLGITDARPKELVMPYITNPIVSNVYTLYYNYYRDFGYFGLFFNFIWGFLHTFYYCRVKIKNNFLSIYFFGLLVYPLLMSFFQDQYMSLLSTWIQLVFYGLIANFFIVYAKQTSTKVINGN